MLGALYNLWEYHTAMYRFHRGLSDPHPYQSWPWQWLLMGRPVLFYSNTDQSCGADRCVAQVLLLGTPLLWWSFIPALAGLAWFGIAARDRRAAAIGLMVAAGLLPWFLVPRQRRPDDVRLLRPARRADGEETIMNERIDVALGSDEGHDTLDTPCGRVTERARGIGS